MPEPGQYFVSLGGHLSQVGQSPEEKKVHYRYLFNKNFNRFVGFPRALVLIDKIIRGRQFRDTTPVGSVADPDPVGSGPFSRIRIRSNFPDPTIKSHITRSKSNKLNRYFCEQFTFFLNKTSKF